MKTSDLVGTVGVTVGGYTLSSDLVPLLRVPTCLAGLTLEQSTETTALAAGAAALTFEALYPAGWPLPQLGHIVELAASARNRRSYPVNVFGGFVEGIEVLGTTPAGPEANARRLPVPALNAAGWTALYQRPSSSTWEAVQRLDATAHDLVAWTDMAAPGAAAGQAIRFYSPPFQWAKPTGNLTPSLWASLAAQVPGAYRTFIGDCKISLQRWAAGTTPAASPNGALASASLAPALQDTITGSSAQGPSPFTPVADARSAAYLPPELWTTGTEWRVMVELTASWGSRSSSEDMPRHRPAIGIAGLELHHALSNSTNGYAELRQRLLSSQGRPAFTRIKVTAADASAWGSRTRVGFTPILPTARGTFMVALNDALGPRFRVATPGRTLIGQTDELGPIDADSQAAWEIQQRVSAANGQVPYVDMNLYYAGGITLPDTFDPRNAKHKPQIVLSRALDHGLETMPRRIGVTAGVITMVAPDEYTAATMPAARIEYQERAIDATGLANEVGVTFKRGPFNSMEVTDETQTYRNNSSAVEFGPSGIAIDTLLHLQPGVAKTGPAFDRAGRVLAAQAQPRYKTPGPLAVIGTAANLPVNLNLYLGQQGVGRGLIVSGGPSWMGDSLIVKGTSVTLGDEASMELTTEPAGYSGALSVTWEELGLLKKANGTPASFQGCTLTSIDLRGVAAQSS